MNRLFLRLGLFLRLACLAFVIAMALRCDGGPVNPDSGGPPPNVSPMASIRGTVTMGGSAVGGAQIILNGPGITRAVTGGVDGTFTFADLPSGVYIVEANLAGVGCERVTSDIEAGETINVDINCAAARPHLIGTITGNVTAGSAPLGGVQVTLTGLPFTGAEAARAVMADSAGRFTFAALTPGTYTVTATAAGFLCLSAIVGVRADHTATASISCAEEGSGSGGGPQGPPTNTVGKIAFERAGRIMVVHPDGSNAITFIDGRAPSWSADGMKLVFQQPGCPDRSVPPYFDCDDIWMIHADGSGLSPITSSQWVLDQDPVWSPDGTKVAFIRWWHGPDQSYLVVSDVNPPPVLWSEIVPSMWWPREGRPTWSPDGIRIAFTCEGRPPRWESDICISPSSYNGGYFTNTNSNFGLVKITNDTWIDSDPAWSPDGTRIAFTTNRDATNGRRYIALMAPNGSGFTRLVPGRRPAWSPDGTRIVFVGEADSPGLYVVSVDGGGLMRITDNPVDTAPSWGP